MPIRSDLLVLLTLVTAATLTGCIGLTSANHADPSIPSITSQLTNQMVVVGQRATFSVAAAGAAPLIYRWMKNGKSINGATSASYTTPAATSSDNEARFTVLVEDSTTRSVISSTAILTVEVLGELKASLSNLDFGDVIVGTHTTVSVTLAAAGGSNVTISNVSISDSHFSASGVFAGLILVPGQSATLNVPFAPAAAGRVTGSVTITSDASNSPVTISLSGSGVLPLPRSVIITWSADAPSAVGYNLYRAAVSGGPYAKLNPSVNVRKTFTDTTVVAGHSYYYVVTSVDSSNVESTHSSEVSVSVPALS